MPRRRADGPSADELLASTGSAVLRSASRIAEYALANLPRVIVDGDKIVWPEAYEALVRKLREEKRDEPTLGDVIWAIDAALDGADPSWIHERLDSLIQSIDNMWVKGLIAAGLAMSRAALKMNEKWVRELTTDPDAIFLKILENGTPAAQQAALLLREHPRLLSVISDYVLLKLGLQRMDNAKPQGPSRGEQAAARKGV